MRFHASKRAIGDMAVKKIADDRLHHWRQGSDTKVQAVRDFDENAGGRLFEGPDDEHAFGESLQVMKRTSVFSRSMICSDVQEIGIPSEWRP
jgi:hypothetical protein